MFGRSSDGVLQASDDGERKAAAVQGDIETYFENDKWKNKVEGSTRAASVHDTKAEAVEKGQGMARERKVEHFIRNMDGQISERSTYGHDPRDIPG